MEIEHEDLRESDKEVDDLFIDEDLIDRGRAAYIVGLSSDMENVDKKLQIEVVNQLNVIRAGLDRQ